MGGKVPIKANRTAPNYNIKTSNERCNNDFQDGYCCIGERTLGQGDETDMLAVSVSSTDAIGHKYGTRGKENHDVYMQLDKDLTQFLNALDEKVGRGNYLLFLTADHGAAHNYNFLKKHRIPGGAFEYKKAVEDLNNHLQKKFGIKPVMGEDNYQFAFNDKMIEKAGKDKDDIIEESVEFLKKDPQYIFVFDEERIATETMPDFIKTRMMNGYMRHRSGEIGVVTPCSILRCQGTLPTTLAHSTDSLILTTAIYLG